MASSQTHLAAALDNLSQQEYEQRRKDLAETVSLHQLLTSNLTEKTRETKI